MTTSTDGCESARVLLAPYFVSDEGRPSVTLDVDTALDDQLAIHTEFSFDLSGWRAAGTNREILVQVGGVRTLRFYDSLPLGYPHRFFVRFRAETDGEP